MNIRDVSRSKAAIVGFCSVLLLIWFASFGADEDSVYPRPISEIDHSPDDSRGWQLAVELQRSAREGDIERFRATGDEFFSTSQGISEVLARMEAGSATPEMMDVAAGAIDAAIRLVKVGRTPWTNEPGWHRRLFDAVLLFDPKTTTAILRRWSKVGIATPDDLELLSVMAENDELMDAALACAVNTNPSKDQIEASTKYWISLAGRASASRGTECTGDLIRLLSLSSNEDAWSALCELWGRTEWIPAVGWLVAGDVMRLGDHRAVAHHLPRLLLGESWSVDTAPRGSFAAAKSETVEMIIQSNFGRSEQLDELVVLVSEGNSYFTYAISQSNLPIRVRALASQLLLCQNPGSASTWEQLADFLILQRDQLACDPVALSRTLAAITVIRSTAEPADLAPRVRSRLEQGIQDLTQDPRLFPAQVDRLREAQRELDEVRSEIGGE